LRTASETAPETEGTVAIMAVAFCHQLIYFRGVQLGTNRECGAVSILCYTAYPMQACKYAEPPIFFIVSRTLRAPRHGHLPTVLSPHAAADDDAQPKQITQQRGSSSSTVKANFSHDKHHIFIVNN
jgi:hypothetical protein